MKDKVDKGCSRSSRIAMWGVFGQLCNHGNIMNAKTVMSSAPIETAAIKLLPKVMDADVDKTVLIDPGILGEIEQTMLWEQIRIAIRSNPKLDLGSDADELIEKAQILKGLTAGTKPQIAEELAAVVKSACGEAGRNVCRQFDLAVAKAPSKVDGIVKEVVDTIERMGQSTKRNDQALAQFDKRIKQIGMFPQLRNNLKESAFDALRSHLLQKGQHGYFEALEGWVMVRFEEHWKAQCELIRERCEKFIHDSNAYRGKVRMCEKECTARLDRTTERLTTFKMSNEIVLEETSDDEFLATLMASRKAGGQTELIDGLRHDLEQRLRELAERKGMGQRSAHDMAFRELVFALPATDIVDAFMALLTEGTSASSSFYQACEAYGLKRLVRDLSTRSKITSWFDGRDDTRFGIIRFDFKMARLPKAITQKEAEIRELIEQLLRAEGFGDIVDNGQARSISVLRIFAGWCIGIEGGNPVLLEAYKKSARTGHLPHLIGILPDTKAGEHAAAIMRL